SLCFFTIGYLLVVQIICRLCRVRNFDLHFHRLVTHRLGIRDCPEPCVLAVHADCYPRSTSCFSAGTFPIRSSPIFRCEVTSSGGRRLSQLFRETSRN